MQTIFGLKIYVPVFIYMGGFSNIFAQIGACHTYFLDSLQNFIYASFLDAFLLYAVQNFICCSEFLYAVFYMLIEMQIYFHKLCYVIQHEVPDGRNANIVHRFHDGRVFKH